MNPRYALLALTLAWGLLDPAAAQQAEWSIYKPTNTGLTGNYVYSLALDDEGAVWIGADDPIWDEGGLGRFDGDVWQSWTNVDGKAPTHYMHDLQIDAQGRKWAASDVGLLRFDGDVVEVVWSTANAPWPTSKVSDFDWDSQGTLWVALNNVQSENGGLARYDGTTWTVYTTANGLPWAAPWNNVTAVEVDGQDRVWFGSNVMGGGMYDGGTWRWLGAEGTWATDIAFAANGEPWYVFANWGVRSWNGQAWTDRSAHFNDYDVASVTRDRLGYIWVTTFPIAIGGAGSIWRFNGTAWDITYEMTGLSHVYALAFDAANRPWVGGIGGLRHQEADGTWSHYNTYNTGLPSRWVDRVFVHSDGTVWFSTSGGGLASFDGTRWAGFNPYNYGSQPWPFPTDSAVETVQDADGNVWTLPTNAGVGRWDGTQWQAYLGTWDIHALTLHPSGDVWIAPSGGQAMRWNGTTWVSMGNPTYTQANAITADAQGRVWLATINGLMKYGGGQWTHYTSQNSGLPDNYVRDVAVDDAGVAWVGTADGLARFDGTTWTVYHEGNSGVPADNISALAFAPDGALWVGAFDGYNWPYHGGVARFDGTDWLTYDRQNSPLPHEQVEGLAVDAQGGVWIATASEGVAHVRLEAAAVAVAAEPVGGPVVIGPGGGSFQFAVTLTNLTNQPQRFQAWSAVTGPVAREPVVGPMSVTLPPGATVVRTLTQAVPANAPAGMYTYTVKLGTFGGAVLASADFPVVKQAARLAAGVSAAPSDAWIASGWSVSEVERWEEVTASAALPGGSALSEAYPNPSRGVASLTLDVVEAQAVRVEVYDGLGRRVAVLLDGDVEAGTHALVFDGSSLPAGVYVVRVTGERFTAARRVVLTR
jgi:ligand-binding sensor domain-containing protein